MHIPDITADIPLMQIQGMIPDIPDRITAVRQILQTHLKEMDQLTDLNMSSRRQVPEALPRRTAAITAITAHRLQADLPGKTDLLHLRRITAGSKSAKKAIAVWL